MSTEAKKPDNDDRPKKDNLRPFLTPALMTYAGCVILAIAITLYSGIRHDYGSYLLQWQVSISGGNPWATQYEGESIPRNAYGPMQVLFARLLVFGDLAPKLAFTALTLVGPALVIMSIPAKERECRSRQLTSAVLLYVCAPIVAITVYIFGINDGVVGFFLLAACILRNRERHGAVGFVLALAALLKFYPILFAPLFAVGRSGTVWVRTTAVAAVTFGLGMYAAYLYWGPSVFSPLQFGALRGPKHLSVLRFLDQAKDELSITPIVEILIGTNSYFVVIVASLVTLWGWVRRQSWEVTVLLGILFVFLSYKVGHQQFYLTWVSVHWWILLASRDERAIVVARAFVPVAVFLSFYQLIYLVSWIFTGEYFRGQYWGLFRTSGSVILLALVTWSLTRCRGAVRTIDRAPLQIRF